MLDLNDAKFSHLSMKQRQQLYMYLVYASSK